MAVWHYTQAPISEREIPQGLSPGNRLFFGAVDYPALLPALADNAVTVSFGISLPVFCVPAPPFPALLFGLLSGQIQASAANE